MTHGNTYRIVPNVGLTVFDERRQNGATLVEERSFQKARNVLCTEGLRKWLDDMVAVPSLFTPQVRLGDGTATPQKSDTGLSSQWGASGRLEGYVVGDAAVFIHWITGPPRDGFVGEVLREVAFTNGAFLLRALVTPEITITATTIVVVCFTIRVIPADNTASKQWLSFGPHWMASRLLASGGSYDPLSHVAFGTGGALTSDVETPALVSEVYRESVTWSRSGDTISASGTVTTGEHGADTFTEFGPAVGSTADEGVLVQEIGHSLDNTANDITYTSTITLRGLTGAHLQEDGNRILLENGDIWLLE